MMDALTIAREDESWSLTIRSLPPRQAAFGPPDGADAGTRRPHQTPAKDASQHRGPR